jgi:Fe2+ transport system protein B
MQVLINKGCEFTIESERKSLVYRDQRIVRIVELPGLYSLA